MTQDEAFEILKLGYNVYLTGAAGSGKTFLLNKYIDFLKGQGIMVGITASTGIAATHIEGLTIHSWSGMGVKNKLETEDIDHLLLKPYLQERFRDTQVLIIDEVSMLHAGSLGMVDAICKAFKGSNEPFGGMQIILCGDFFQLPPVSKNGNGDSFVDQSEAWNEANIKVCYLTDQYRQEDQNFLRLLNEIRGNEVSHEMLRILMSRLGKASTVDIPPTKLYTHNIDVDAINNFELNKINEKQREFNMTGWGDEKLVEGLKKGCLAPEKLILKKGAVVMFVKNNFHKGYVNGTLGKVIKFDSEGYPVIKTASGRNVIAKPESWTIEEKDVVKAEISQIPLRLAWAITVHKSQGMSLDAAEIDLSKSFVAGMGYVALSRVRTLNGIRLMGINKMALSVNENVLESDITFRELSKEAANELNRMDTRQKSKMQKAFLEKIKRSDIPF